MKGLAILAFAAVVGAAVTMPVTAAHAYGPKVKTQKLTGWVGDEHCGAKSADAAHAECAKKCVAGGAAIVFVNAKDKSVLKVDNQDALKEHVGQYVRVSGPVTDGSLHVDKVDVLKAPKPKPAKGEHKPA